jgi:hypothetical protein
MSDDDQTQQPEPDEPATSDDAPAPVDSEGSEEIGASEAGADEAAAGETAPKSNKRWKIAAVVAVLAAALSVGVLASLLFAGGSGAGGDVLACVPSRDYTKNSDPNAGDTCPPKGAKYTDGLVEKAEGGDFTIRSIEGGRLGKTLKLFVREPDRAYIDVQHAQTHAALGQPVRVFTKPYEGREIVIYMEDSPLLK